MADEPVCDRRRLLALAAGISLAAIADPGRIHAAKRDKDEKKRSKGKNERKNKEKKKGKKTKKGQSAGGSGEKVVKEAKKHKGDRYKWGGESPGGFDCSGFTWYVYDKAVGKDIGRTVKDQYKQGKSVDSGSWKPGDVVFFKNTFEHGLSHNGIYVSGNKFIHAENEDTGVVLSSLDSGYYKDHYAGARRIV